MSTGLGHDESVIVHDLHVPPQTRPSAEKTTTKLLSQKRICICCGVCIVVVKRLIYHMCRTEKRRLCGISVVGIC